MLHHGVVTVYVHGVVTVYVHGVVTVYVHGVVTVYMHSVVTVYVHGVSQCVTSRDVLYFTSGQSMYDALAVSVFGGTTNGYVQL